ncbi:50S ribosomal protein L5 [Candidatus Woesearchaeota archaeon]|nr:50S ribosomal protein L5 [Candidatus Woesearchaeota archaeon]
MNSMKEIRIEKVTLNVGTGEAGSKLEKAMKLLQNFSNQKPVATVTKKRIPTWGVRPGMSIGAKVTLRKNQDKFVENMLSAIGNKLSEKKIGDGTFSFGISEYIHVPGAKYDTSIGIIGFGIMVTLERKGFRVKKRIVGKSKIPQRHLISKQETINFLKDKFKTKIED